MEKKPVTENGAAPQTESDENIRYAEMQIDGDVYETFLSPKYLNKKPPEKVNKKQIKAFIPGMIRLVFVKPGDKVKQGDKLIILEAMKMLNEIRAEFNGTIKDINVKKSDLVTKHQVLLEFK